MNRVRRIGNARSSQNSRPASGSTYVIYGKADANPIDVNSLGASGFRIDGASAGDQSATSATGVGDVNADGFDDVAIGAPAATSTGSGEATPRASSGKAYIVYGSAAPNGVDLAGLGTAGYAVLGGVGDRIGSSITTLGDLDGDSIADFAIGGHGAFVVTGHDNTTDAIDLADPSLSGWRVEAPAGAGTDAVVAGGSDLNDDLLNDVLVSYPSLARSYLVYTQDGLIDKLPQAAAVDGAPGQRSTRYTASQTGDATGTSIDAVDVLPDGRSGSIIGASRSSPGDRSAAGSAFVAAAPPSAPGPVPISGTRATQFVAPRPSPAASAPPGTVVSGIVREPKCAPAAGWQFFDAPVADGLGGLQPQNFHFYGCVKSSLGNKVRNPRNEGCGKNDPKGCKQTKFRAPNAYGFQGRMRVRMQLVDTDTTHMTIVVQQGSPADQGTPIPQDPNDTLKREYAWPMVDSFGTAIGYIREIPKRKPTPASAPGVTPVVPADPGVSPRTFRIWNSAKKFMGSANPNIGNLTVEGRPCATSAAAPESYALIFLGDGSVATDVGALNGNFLTVRALLSRRALAPNALTGKVDNDKAIDAYWAPCSKPKKLPKTLPAPAAYSTPNFQARNDSLYLSRSGAESLGYADAFNLGGVGTPLLNYTWPQLAPTTNRPQYPPFTVLTPAPTTVQGGGLTRGVMVDRSVRYQDGFNYLDPNLVCSVHENWSWSLISASGIYEYVPRKIGDGNSALPGPRPAAADPTKPDDPAHRQILESFRPCR